MWNVAQYLSQFHISLTMVDRIFKALGQDTIQIIKENPYSLMKFVKRLDFKTVDSIGRNLGLSLDNEERVDTGVIYSLNLITEFGHTCIEYDTLVDYAAGVLEVEKECIKNVYNKNTKNQYDITCFGIIYGNLFHFGGIFCSSKQLIVIKK